jgi:hypothetical protein
MHAPTCGLLIAMALAGVLAPARTAAQASPYIPLDDPRLPLLEHLIARSVVEDPSPMVRPFRRADALRALAHADTTAGSSSLTLIRRLREDFADRTGNSWSIDVRAGAQAYSRPRRELLHPAGASGVRPYAELRGAATFGNIVLVTRPVVEPRLKNDPDWPGRRDADVPARMADAYLAAQFKYGSVFYGQMGRNWGPVGLAGIPLSDYGYDRQGLALEVGTRTLRLSALATDLQDELDSLGRVVHRYYFVHRLHASFSRRFSLALWEGVVLAGAGRNFETRYRNPLSVSYLANTIGLGDRGNVLLGADIRWRTVGRTTFNAQLALDDFWYHNRRRNRDRWAFTVGAEGPILKSAAWHALYTQVSSLALRAFNSAENFTDAGVGTGRNFSDQDQLSLKITVPVRDRWLLSPELTVLRQGQGRINDPYPEPDANGVLETPALFIGIVERTYRAAIGVSGATGLLELTANAGVHRVVNSGHEQGRTVNRFEGRVQVTVGFSEGGVLE